MTDAKTRVYEQFEGTKCAEQTLNPHAEEYSPTQATQNDTQRMQHLHQDRDQARPVNNDGSSGRSSERTLQELLQQQNDITKLLIDQHKKSPILPCEIPNFNGDSLEYRSFVRAFEHGIEDKTKSSKDRIYILSGTVCKWANQ